MAQDVPSAQGLPFAVSNRTIKADLCCLWREHTVIMAEEGGDSISLWQPGREHINQFRAQRDSTCRPPSFHPLLFPNRDRSTCEVYVLRPRPHHFTSADPGVCHEDAGGKDPRADFFRLHMVKKLINLRADEVKALPEFVGVSPRRDPPLDLRECHERQLVVAFRVHQAGIRRMGHA